MGFEPSSDIRECVFREWRQGQCLLVASVGAAGRVRTGGRRGGRLLPASAQRLPPVSSRPLSLSPRASLVHRTRGRFWFIQQLGVEHPAKWAGGPWRSAGSPNWLR